MARIVKTSSIAEYIAANQQFAGPLEAWVEIVRTAKWEKPQDIVDTFGAKGTDILGNSCNRVVIDVKGNHIRIIAKYQFHEKQKDTCWLFIKWIGTHREYDGINKRRQQYTIEMF